MVEGIIVFGNEDEEEIENAVRILLEILKRVKVKPEHENVEPMGEEEESLLSSSL